METPAEFQRRSRSRSGPRSRSGSPIITHRTIIQSYESRDVKFETDDGPKRSAASQNLETRGSPKQHAVQYSAPAAELRPDGKIVQIESSLSDSGILGTIRSVSYGTWEGRPACLIAMRYFFRFSEGNRFKSTEVVITFDKVSKTDPRNAPVVRNISPRKVYGAKSEETKAWHYDIKIEAALPSGPASAMPSVGGGKEGSFTREHHLEIIGKPWMSRDHSDLNQVVWTAHETRTQKHGIPDELNLAVVVEYDGPFQALVEAEGKVARNITLRAWPWDRKHPLLFDGVTSIGKTPPSTEFDKLTAAQWRSLAPYSGEFQDVVSLEEARARLSQEENGTKSTTT